jgi:hypothetical protein
MRWGKPALFGLQQQCSSSNSSGRTWRSQRFAAAVTSAVAAAAALLCQCNKVPGCSSLLPDIVIASDCNSDDSSSATTMHRLQPQLLQLIVNKAPAKHTFMPSALLPHCK